MFTYEYYLTMFLIYNNRRCHAEWRNETEEKIVKQHEEFYASQAALHMPETQVEEIVELCRS